MRREWLQRIVDHDGTRAGSGGIEMWIRLGEALGVPRAEMEDERHVLPGVRFATEAYVTFCKTRPWIDAVASSLTELFAPDLMRKRIAAFPQHYPWVRPEALDYFKSRLTQAPRDSQQGLRLVLAHCTTVETQRRAFDALAFKLELLWVMIDTIHHAYLEPLKMALEPGHIGTRALAAGAARSSTRCVSSASCSIRKAWSSSTPPARRFSTCATAAARWPTSPPSWASAIMSTSRPT